MLNELTIHQAHDKIQNGEVTSIDLTKACFERIKKVDDQVKAFLTLIEEDALEQAGAVDAEVKAGKQIGILAGIPVAVKDNLCTRGVKTTAASNILKNYIPPYDATTVDLLKEAGAVIVGKTNLDAFAHGSSTETSDWQTTHNPWDLDRIPGGSSGGSAAAVAAFATPYAIGSETGGSIRQPAALCGVVGWKPTYGRVSRYGLLAMGSSLDCVGALATTVEGTAAVAGVISGPDPKDSTTANMPIKDYESEMRKGAMEIKIGIPDELFPEGINSEVEKLVRGAAQELTKHGAKVVPVALPMAKYASAVYAVITPSEISANLARYDGIRYGYSVTGDKDAPIPKNLFDVYAESRARGFGDEAKRRIMTGVYALSSGYYDAYYLKASKVRTLIRRDWENAFKEVDIVIGPTSPSIAQKIGKAADDPLFGYLSDELINPSSIAGLPGISVPCGFVEDGSKKLPVGMQLVGNYFREDQVFRTAFAYEQATPSLRTVHAELG
ncbi:Asp-tRNA(Asn)/Glu-tRNA(Gln) amidotransferase subunit GatA [Patescibacteria group bacterium]